MIDVDVRLRRGRFDLQVAFRTEARSVALFGRSGAGKSTLIALLAGLVAPDAGHVRIDGESLVDVARGVFVPPHRRRLGLVFQDSLLFPHMSVRQNLLYGRRSAPGRAQDAQFDAVVGMLGIEGLVTRRPGGLSGGERQRVAIGRALLSDPRLLLLDEPLASLDFERKQEIMPYIARLRDESGLPLVYVTHAADEVARIAEHVVVLQDGRVVAAGDPGEVLAPARVRDAGGRFAAVSIIDAEILGYDERYGLTSLGHPAGNLSVPGRLGAVGARHRLLVRATDVALAVQRPRDVSFRTVMRGVITDIEVDEGPVARVEIALKGHGRLVSLVTRKSVDELAIDRGDELFAMVKAISLDERTLAFAPRALTPAADDPRDPRGN